MPDLTLKLGLKLPLGNEAVNRVNYRENLEIIEQNAASQAEVTETKETINQHLIETVQAHGGIVASSEVVTNAAPGKILKLNEQGKLPADITGDAATLGGVHLIDLPQYDLTRDINGNILFDLCGQGNADPVTGISADWKYIKDVTADLSSAFWLQFDAEACLSSTFGQDNGVYYSAGQGNTVVQYKLVHDASNTTINLGSCAYSGSYNANSWAWLSGSVDIRTLNDAVKTQNIVLKLYAVFPYGSTFRTANVRGFNIKKNGIWRIKG